MSKRLYRSNSNVMLTGVLGGVAEYFHVDPTLVRLAYVVLWVFTAGFPLFLLYILAAIIIPKSDVYSG
ncbi:phage shock protein C [Natronobacillus azotifigens]|uniref:PspC domain-containing protein n=1 Tax=Natronobacillus azotifigens TaxID=472978 RepID=A0A9J6RCB1_9BACI|nr:PspC domain-containing protein [Natronobacillus azotifigens]MCZ0703336.1 PspC domain-containing protein [Natronobacillus azotifigens]